VGDNRGRLRSSLDLRGLILLDGVKVLVLKMIVYGILIRNAAEDFPSGGSSKIGLRERGLLGSSCHVRKCVPRPDFDNSLSVDLAENDLLGFDPAMQSVPAVSSGIVT